MLKYLLAAAFTLLACTTVVANEIQSFPAPYNTIGSIESYSAELSELIDPEAKLEILAEGFRWSEGPVWDQANDRLLFTDVPNNVAYAWTENDGVSIFLKPSGHPEMQPEGLGSPGANGLAFTPDGQLALCQHGNKRIALYDEATNTFTSLVDSYGEQKFYSPNDLVFAADGTVYFTDPPYGILPQNRTEIANHYVYRRLPDGTVEQLIDSIVFPNGIGLSPDGSTLYVASSNRKAPGPGIYAYQIASDGTFSDESKLFFDANPYHNEQHPGACDGLKVDSQGNVWATGPGGVFIIKPNGEILGRINTQGRLANLAFGGPENRTLYITAAKRLLRIETKTNGLKP